MPPTSEKLFEVEGAYWFGSVRASVCACVSYAYTRSRTVRGRMLKFGMWFQTRNNRGLLADPYFFFQENSRG